MATPTWNEQERLAALHRYGILDTPPEETYDDIVQVVCDSLQVPIAAINLIAEHRQWFKAEIGLNVREMELDNSICARAILQSDFFVVPDTMNDAQFDCNPLVTSEPGLRFYAGALLKTEDGFPIGTLCPRPEASARGTDGRADAAHENSCSNGHDHARARPTHTAAVGSAGS